MNTTPSTTWPYEHRFECCVRGSLLAVPPTVWSTALSLAECAVTSHGKTPECHSYILNSGFLLVFNNRCVFVSNTPRGLVDPATYLFTSLAEKQPTYASITRRYPVGEDLLSLAIAGLDESQLPPVTARLESGTVHEWAVDVTLAQSPPQTLTLLLHGLVDNSDSSTCRNAVSELFPEFLVVVDKPSDDSFMVTAVSGTQYVALRRTEGTYVSLEVSVLDWHRAEALISQALLLFKPAVVAPIWTGAPLEKHPEYSSSNDDLLR
jgi:hypothetical protein